MTEIYANKCRKMKKLIVQKFWMLFLTLVVASPEGKATHLRWPAGRYGLPNTIHGCPNAEGFTWASGNINQALNSRSNQSSPSHLKVTVTAKGVKRSFCIKNAIDSLDPERPAWPAGKYCIYRKGGRCPIGLKPGSLLWDNRFDFSFTKVTGVVPDGLSTSSNTLINFCCAVNGDKTNPIPLPLESPFYLLAYQSTACQEVRGALHRSDFIYYDTDGTNRLSPPYPYRASVYSMKINYCYYQACWNNLTSLNGTVMSPFYPTDYPSNTNCRWRIEVPADYTITLEFADVDLEPSASCTKDWLQVSTGNPPRVLGKYCGKKTFAPLESRSNVVVLDFHSNGVTSSNKGFKVRYQGNRIPVSTTTTTQPTVSKTTKPIVTTTLTTISSTNNPETSAPTRTTTTQAQEKTTHALTATQGSTMSTTEENHDKTSPLTDESRPSLPATPLIRGASKEDSVSRVWVLPVVVCLSIVALAALVLLLYCKCLRKRNTIRRRHSTVKYDKKCGYVDMEFPSNAAVGSRSNPNDNEEPVFYDNYPGDDNESCEPNKKDAVQGPIYQEIKDPDSIAVGNDYAATPTGSRSPRTAHVYESATLPPKK